MRFKHLEAVVGKPLLCVEAGFLGTNPDDEVVKIDVKHAVIHLKDGDTVTIEYGICKSWVIEAE